MKDLTNCLVLYNADLKPYNSFRTGGKARELYLPQSLDELIWAVEFCQRNKTPHYIIGQGTNLLVADEGVDGAVIVTRGINGISLDGNILTVGAGTLIAKAARLAVNNGLGGLEFASFIPGTVGGAIAMNAGAHGGEIGDCVKTVLAYSEGNIAQIDKKNCGFGYRKSVFLNARKMLILGAEFQLKNAQKNQLLDFVAGIKSWRIQHQPQGVLTAGSTFKALKQGAAGALIEKCGLKGLKIGGAEVSKIHANFIINSGNATTKDILNLIEILTKKLTEFCGEVPELEIQKLPF